MADHRAPKGSFFRKSNPSKGVDFHPWYPVVAVLLALYVAAIGVYHAQQVNIAYWRVPVIIVSFGWLILNLTAAHFNRPVNGPVPGKRVGVVIPSYNEDPAMIRVHLASLDAQLYLPYAVYFCENGDTNGVAEQIFREWAAQTRIPRPVFLYLLKASKRGAQVAALARLFAKEDGVDIICTVDGDTELDSRAIHEGLKPFADPRVTGVGGLLLGKNKNRNLLTLIVDLGFVSSFMNGRSAWSSLKSVAVNCGGLAFYRSDVVKSYLYEYRNQRILGREVNSGDDRMLTGYAAYKGQTVFQHTSVGYTLLPKDVGHLTRQRGRWWRSFWWGTIWILRRFNPNRAIWWLALSQLITFALYSVIFPLVLIYDPITHDKVPWMFFAYVAALAYARTARTLMVNRPDQSSFSQILQYLLLAPLVTLTNFWLCSVLQYWGLLTFYITDWRTRRKVEVGLH